MKICRMIALSTIYSKPFYIDKFVWIHLGVMHVYVCRHTSLPSRYLGAQCVQKHFKHILGKVINRAIVHQLFAMRQGTNFFTKYKLSKLRFFAKKISHTLTLDQFSNREDGFLLFSMRYFLKRIFCYLLSKPSCVSQSLVYF